MNFHKKYYFYETTNIFSTKWKNLISFFLEISINLRRPFPDLFTLWNLRKERLLSNVNRSFVFYTVDGLLVVFSEGRRYGPLKEHRLHPSDVHPPFLVKDVALNAPRVHSTPVACTSLPRFSILTVSFPLIFSFFFLPVARLPARPIFLPRVPVVVVPLKAMHEDLTRPGLLDRDKASVLNIGRLTPVGPLNRISHFYQQRLSRIFWINLRVLQERTERKFLGKMKI